MSNYVLMYSLHVSINSNNVGMTMSMLQVSITSYNDPTYISTSDLRIVGCVDAGDAGWWQGEGLCG